MKRKILAAALACALLLTACSPTLRQAVTEFVVSVYERFVDLGGTTARETIETIYVLDPVPEGFEFVSNIEINNKDEMQKIIMDAMKKNESINISYLNLDGSIYNRDIHPLQMFRYKNIDFVTAYCELRKDIRHFELNRIKKIN